MANFDIRRFGLVLRWMAVSTRKEVLSNTGAMFFAYMVVFVTNMLSSLHADFEHAESRLDGAVVLNTMVFMVICVIGGCWIINNMRTKEQRITFIMLPASRLEKFVARAFYVTVVWAVMAFAAYCLADVFRILMSLVMGVHVVGCTIPRFLSQIFDDYIVPYFIINKSSWVEMLLLAAYCSWVFWIHSIYVLGGVFFRRRQFVLTSCFNFLLAIAGTLVASVLLKNYLAVGSTGNIGILAIAACVVFILWGAADWWLAYRLFRRMQVINNKWINL